MSRTTPTGRGSSRKSSDMDTQQTPSWKCQSSGDCCRVPKAVVMTFAERRELEAVAHKASRPLRWLYNARPSMTQLQTAPCPFVTPENQCAVYDVRPFSCRRYACMREDVKAEPFRDESTADIAARKPEALPQLLQIQRDGQKWAIAHSWREDH